MEVCGRETPNKIDTALNITVAEHLCTLVSEESVLETDERTTIGSNIRAIEVSSQRCGIRGLRICVYEVDVI
jgi:hypothetical protein